MAEGARLESVFTRKGNVGSNPTLSASFFGMKGLAPISSMVSSNGDLKGVGPATFRPSYYLGRWPPISIAPRRRHGSENSLL